MKMCKNAQLTFLISSLIQNSEALNGAIVEAEKIHEYNNEFSLDEINNVLDCFVENGLLVKYNFYSCFNNHTFSLNDNLVNEDYFCHECDAEGFDDKEISNEDLKSLYIKTTYRINKFNNSIWKAKALYISNDIESALKLMITTLKEQDKKFSELSRESKIEKISSHFGLGNDLLDFAEKVNPYLEKIPEFFS